MRYPQLLAVGIVALLFASPTERTYGGPMPARPVLTAMKALHLPELADTTVERAMRSHTGSSVLERLKSWLSPGKSSRPWE